MAGNDSGTTAMVRRAEDSAARELIPKRPSLRSVSEAAQLCQACPLWQGAMQTVFGEGSAGAELMLVGEQPGDQEDIEGHPFVGPSERFSMGRWKRPGSTVVRST